MRMKKLAALSMAAIMGVMMAVPAMAATTYTPVAGTSTTFTKYLIMDEGDTVPNTTFKFTVAPGQPISADTSSNATMEVMAGLGTPTIADVTFSPADSTVLAANVSGIDIQRDQQDRTGTAGTDTVQLDAGEKYAQKTATVSFSGISFPEPGIYRYIITETAATAAQTSAGIVNDTDTDRVLDVYVTDDGTGSLVVSGYVLHTDVSNVAISASMGSNDVAQAGATLADKTDGFTNEVQTKDLKVEKAVAGNQASRDKYFELTVTCTNIDANGSYVVSIADDSNANTNDGYADATSGSAQIGGTIAANAGKTNPTVVTGQNLLDGQKFYLQHGQSVVIRGLAPDVSYTVTENAEDYASTVKSGDTNTGVLGTVAGANKMATAGFLNTRDGIVPTGVLMTVIPGVMVLAGGAAGLVAVAAKRRKEEEE